MALHKRLFGILLCFVLASCASAQKADVAVPASAAEKKISARVEAQIKILERLSAKSKLTCANLKTWKGEIRVDDITYFFGDGGKRFLDFFDVQSSNVPDEFMQKSTSMVTFSLDAENDTLYTRFETQSSDYVDSAKGASLSLGVDFALVTQVSIVTPEGYIHFQPNMHYAQSEGKGRRVAFCDDPEEGRRESMGMVVDPRLTLLGYGGPISENLDLLIRALRENGELKANDSRLEISSKGATTVVRVPGIAGPDQVAFQELKFVDDNLVASTYREGNGDVSQSQRWSYMKQNGVLIPSGFVAKSFDDGERIASQRSLRVLHSTSNAAIAPATFTRGNLGLVEGDRFVDRVAGTVSRLDNGVFRSVPAEQAQKWLAPR